MAELRRLRVVVGREDGSGLPPFANRASLAAGNRGR